MTSFRINRVYTRSGDAGDTALVGGKRVSKAAPRVSAYGDIDELNSVLGLIKERLTPKTKILFSVLEGIQQELFDLGSELATPPESEYPGMWKVSHRHVEAIEKLCDCYGDGLPELSSFILPGGNELASLFHIGRTVARRAERTVVSMFDELTALGADLGNGAAINVEIVKYINRISDFLFILARWALQQEGGTAPLWVPEKDRP